MRYGGLVGLYRYSPTFIGNMNLRKCSYFDLDSNSWQKCLGGVKPCYLYALHPVVYSVYVRISDRQHYNEKIHCCVDGQKFAHMTVRSLKDETVGIQHFSIRPVSLSQLMNSYGRDVSHFRVL
jgi:hypothetical protein